MRLDESDYEKDMEHICRSEFIPWEQLKDRTIFVTGATGLIGFTLVNALLYADRERRLDLSVMALVRNLDEAKQRFCHLGPKGEALHFVEGDVEHLPALPLVPDYIVHGAGRTASEAFVRQPVETIYTAVRGTGNILELAREKKVSGVVYLSSMEVYGCPEKGHKVTEEETGAWSPLEVRSSYPLSKQLCENLCAAYASEYGVPAVILRLAQIFGPGANSKDRRIPAEFRRCVLEKRDIVLHTKGETEHSYLYTADAASAILTVLLRGEPGQAYNAADEGTYCSIAELAEKAAGAGNIRVRYEPKDEAGYGYPKTLYLNMDTSRLRALGWETTDGRICGGGRK